MDARRPELADEVTDPWEDYTEPIVAFKASVDGVRSGRGMGELYMTLRIPMEYKHDAMELSNTVGLIFQVSTFRKPRMVKVLDVVDVD